MSDTRHQQNLSINSINSLIEPTTPPSFGKTLIWDNGGKGAVSMGGYNGLNSMGASGIHSLTNGGNGVGGQLGGSLSGPSGGQMGGMVGGATGALQGAHTGGHGPGDHKLDKEYLSGLNKVPLDQLKLEILKLAKDQYGCRFLQKKIDENVTPSPQIRMENFKVIFKEIYPYIYELIIDPFGNYLVQKLIDYCDDSNLNLILEILQYNLFQISINQHGTRALQKIINSLNNDYQLSLLISGLSPFIIELIKDLNGNHVIQKILNKYSPENCQFIYDSIINDLFVVATHKHGCCVLQKCLNHVNSMQLVQFSQKILMFDTFRKLTNDQFGNYVLQYLISINSISINLKMYENFIKFGVNNLCNLKFSSNVVEKFLKNCYVNEATNPAFSNLKLDLCLQVLQGDLNKMINDPFGNYVIQTLIDILVNPCINYTNPLNENLLVLLPLNFNVSSLTNQQIQIAIIKNWFANCKIVSSFGKRIQLKINSILNGTTTNNNNSSSNAANNQTVNFKNYNYPALNMNANGEFVNSEFPPHLSQQPHKMHQRNLSIPLQTAPFTPLQTVTANNYTLGNNVNGGVVTPGSNESPSNLLTPNMPSYTPLSNLNVPHMNNHLSKNPMANDFTIQNPYFNGNPANNNQISPQFVLSPNIKYYQN
ncbi:uncharacterized protein AC631_03255 [Debaryomyces fabryi]|uniref:PUM-HD domain-containing protein n=1 Tax=Debaryomyces fabryi TaxID=58627 RepID=A0A0V1PY10_9ASCO|nr:uncharacterized protein AC631_03255 [Debaryomyces fabryi]KSA01004.1 hypothetical protein AC631_03255 [Debaryomyces fabryi]CUM55388.1 unnamed protein product [Debaryomyces fabryi]